MTDDLGIIYSIQFKLTTIPKELGCKHDLTWSKYCHKLNYTNKEIWSDISITQNSLEPQQSDLTSHQQKEEEH